MTNLSGFLISFFVNPNIWGILIAVIFGIVWLVCFWPSMIRIPWHWAILVASAFITLIALSYIQRPLQNIIGNGMLQFWGEEALMKSLLITAIPTILVSGLVQEGAKLVPVVVYWWRKNMKIDYKLGLTLGAAAGAGFGILEAQWIHNVVFASGWSWDLTYTKGIEALLPFIERFFAVAFHVSASALAGYGLATGRGWQFYIVVAVLHTIINYGVIFVQAKVFSVVEVEILIAILAIIVAAIALWLRWRKTNNPNPIGPVKKLTQK
jgi:RsiW-degrading membrane proteinase PrsW (M82 family)